MSLRRRSVPALLAAAAISFSACGSDDEAGDSPEPTVVSTDVAAPTTSPNTGDDADAAITDETELDTAALARRIDATVDALTLDTEVVLPGAELEACAVPDHDELLGVVFGDLVPAGVDLQRDGDAIVTGQPGFATLLPINDIVLLGCSATDDGDDFGDNGVGIDVGDPISNVGAYAREFNDPENVGGLEYEVTPSTPSLGGEVTISTVRSADDPRIDIDEVIWSDGEAMISAYVFGPDLAGAVDLAALEANLIAVVPDLVERAFAE